MLGKKSFSVSQERKKPRISKESGNFRMFILWAPREQTVSLSKFAQCQKDFWKQKFHFNLSHRKNLSRGFCLLPSYACLFLPATRRSAGKKSFFPFPRNEKNLEFQKKVETFECSSFERRENEQWAFRSLHSATEIFENKNSISICHREKKICSRLLPTALLSRFFLSSTRRTAGKKVFFRFPETKKT